RRERAPRVDVGLGALGLDLVQDTGELGDLRLAEPELVGEEAERTPHAERARAGVTTVRRRRPARVPGVLVSGTPATTHGMAALRTAVGGPRTGPPPVHHSRMHVFSFSRGALAPGGDFGRGHHASRDARTCLRGP